MSTTNKKKILRGMALILAAISLTGCDAVTNKSDNISTETMRQGEQLIEAVQKIENSIVEDHNEKFTKLDYNISNKGGEITNCPIKQNYCYGVQFIYIGDLVAGENIKSIEYSLSNCVGTFMDNAKDNTNIDIERNIVELENKSYLLEGNDQSEVYFSVYYYYNETHSSNEQTLEIQKCIKNLRITANITFQDGTKETRNYGVIYASERSSRLSNMNFCLLE